MFHYGGNEPRPILIPTIFFVVWIIALSGYQKDDYGRIFAISDLTLCVITMVFQWFVSPTIAYSAFTIISIAFFGFGYYSFQAVTGLTAVEVYQQSANGWLNYPFLLRVVYFQLYLRLVGLILAGLLVASAYLLRVYRKVEHHPVDSKAEIDSYIIEVPELTRVDLIKEPSLDVEDRHYKAPSVSDVEVGISPWILMEKLCFLCDLPLDDFAQFLPCEHAFHSACISAEKSGSCPTCEELQAIHEH